TTAGVWGVPLGPRIELLDGDRAVRLSEVLAVREVMGVILQIFDREPVALGHPDLLEDRIGLDVDADRAPHLLLAEPVGSADVEDRVGVLVQGGAALALKIASASWYRRVTRSRERPWYVPVTPST